MNQRNIEAIYPLSPAQQGMLFETLASPHSGIHLEQGAWKISGALDAELFEQAWQELMARHAILRTGFVWQNQKEPLQIVLRQVDVPLVVDDWREIATTEQEERLDAELREQRQDGFKLQKPPLLRLRLLRTDDETWYFLWTHHHILMDGWCRPLLLRELFTLYGALATGEELDLPRSLPYREYITWLRKQDPAATEAFWREALGEVLQPTALGRETPSAEPADEHFGQLRASLSEDETEALKQLVQDHRLTLNTLVQGVWALLLGRYSGRDKVVFGVTVSGRPAELEGVESTVGLFINTLPLVVEISPPSALGPWLGDLQETNAEMRRFEQVASGQIQQWSPVPGALPLYESLLVFENYPTGPASSSSTGLAVEPRRSSGMGGRTRHPLTWLISCGSRLHLQLIYHGHRIEHAAAERVVEHFQDLLKHLATHRAQTLQTLLEAVPQGEIPTVRPRPERRVEGKGGMPPRNSIEEALVLIWSEVLGVPGLGIEDSFFDLGGHSQLALQLVALVRRAFQLEIPLRTLFDNPTVATLGAEIARRQGREEAYEEDLAALPTVVPDPQHRSAPFPLTDIQQAYWLGRTGAFELGNVATHLYRESEGEEVDLERYTAAWRRLIARHDMLRAVFADDGTQRILADVPPYEIDVLDLREMDPQGAEEELATVRERMSHQVLPADRWPLFEVRLSRLPGGRVRFHISLDLLIGDAWSWRILFRELAMLYREPTLPLPSLELSFRDYVLAQKGLQESALYERSAAYWRQRLDTLPAAPELPLARNPATVERPRFARRTGQLDATAWSRLKDRALGRGLTPSGLLLAAFAEVLAMWSKSPRFTINLTLFNRLPLHPQVDQVIGDFTSLMLLAADQSAGETFEDRARRLQQQLWDDLDHRYVSGVWVQRELSRAQGRPARGFMPVVFTSTLTFKGSAPGTPTGGPPSRDGAAGDDRSRRQGSRGSRGQKRDGLPAKRVYGITQTPQVWLDHQVSETPDGRLHINWDAVEDLFPPGLLDEMFTAFRGLLERLAHGDTPWQAPTLELVPAQQLAARTQINDTNSPVPETLLHTLFSEQAMTRPEHPAVISAERTLTYGELHRLTHRLAHRLRHRLRQLGARPNTLVAVVMDKGWQQIPAVLGVLASGAAYLPLDGELPIQRLHELLALGEVRLALTQSKWLDSLTWPPGVEPLAVDAPEFEHPGDDEDAPLPAVQGPEDLAYVIFTSGSTGVPKGVMIEHRSAVNTILDMNRRFAVGPTDRVLALSALSFDLSVFDVFGLLAAGGTVVLPEARATRDPARWLELMEEEGVTLWNSVPALMQMLVEYAAGQGRNLPPTLRLALWSGDWIPLDLPQRVRELHGEVDLVSLGGATEASIWSILYPIEAVATEWKSIPYGRPMVNQSFQVLDGALEPRPLWVPGQLYIGGVGLARGYWRDEETTRRSFITHPRTGERLYRTGDLGRYLPDGNIEFLGREDSQVKIQGFRIELGEVEAALAQHPAVQEVVVTAVGPPRGEKHLAAYVVVDGMEVHRESPPREAGSGSRNPTQKLAHKMSQPALRSTSGVVPVVLPRQQLDDRDIERLYLTRRSHREFRAETIPLDSFSQLLACLAQLRLPEAPLPKYRYASAGSLYPIQVYFYIKPDRIEGIPGGLYYYHPVDHQLMPLAPEARLDASIYAPVNRVLWNGAAFSIFLVAHMDAIRPLYGAASERFAHLEAGAISHLLETSAPSRGLGLCQIGELDFDKIRPFFDLGENHLFAHSLVGGAIDPEATTLAAFLEAAREYRSLLELATPGPGAHRPPRAPSPTNEGETEGEREQAMTRTLRSFLRERLPDYMIPSHFMQLETLPLTANGKVDRAALPQGELRERPKGPAYVAPTSDLEQRIAALWQETLHAEKVGVRDNFFDLGGNSLLVVRVYNKLRTDLGREFPLVTLFEHPTISSLVEFFSAEEPARSALDRGFDRGARRKRRRRSN